MEFIEVPAEKTQNPAQRQDPDETGWNQKWAETRYCNGAGYRNRPNNDNLGPLRSHRTSFVGFYALNHGTNPIYGGQSSNGLVPNGTGPHGVVPTPDIEQSPSQEDFQLSSPEVQ